MWTIFALHFFPVLINNTYNNMQMFYYGLISPCMTLLFYFNNHTFLYSLLPSLPSKHYAILSVSWRYWSYFWAFTPAVHSAWRTNPFPRFLTWLVSPSSNLSKCQLLKRLSPTTLYKSPSSTHRYTAILSPLIFFITIPLILFITFVISGIILFACCLFVVHLPHEIASRLR